MTEAREGGLGSRGRGGGGEEDDGDLDQNEVGMKERLYLRLQPLSKYPSVLRYTVVNRVMWSRVPRYVGSLSV